MSEQTITVTEAARNFSDCVNRSHYQNTTFLLLKNGVPFARIVPAGVAECRGKELAAALEAADLSAKDARDWNRDIQSARKKLKPPVDRWQ